MKVSVESQLIHEDVSHATGAADRATVQGMFIDSVRSWSTLRRSADMMAVMENKLVNIGVVTVSDRASRGEYEDLGGPAVVKYFQDVLATPHEVTTRVISDEQPLIEQTLRDLEQAGCCLVVTTGGTGPSKRDVTPEATEAVCDKLMPGFGELMRTVSLTKVPTAILSRQTAGILGNALVINLPGQPKAIAECLDAVMAAVPHCITLLDGPRIDTNPERLVAFRPKGWT